MEHFARQWYMLEEGSPVDLNRVAGEYYDWVHGTLAEMEAIVHAERMARWIRELQTLHMAALRGASTVATEDTQAAPTDPTRYLAAP